MITINLGYCCISVLHKELQCGRSSTKTYLEKHTEEYCHNYLYEKAQANLNDLMELLKLNHEQKIQAFRIPEQILPQLDLEYYTVADLETELKAVGKVANDRKIQISTHPSQYFVLNSKPYCIRQ